MQIERKGRMSKSVYVWRCFITLNYWDVFFVVRTNDSFNFPLGWIKCIVIVGTEASKQLPTQDINQERFFCWEKEMFIWRTALQYRYSSIVNSDIKFEISDFDSDNAPLDLIHLAKTAPPELTTTVVYSVITHSWWPNPCISLLHLQAPCCVRAETAQPGTAKSTTYSEILSQLMMWGFMSSDVGQTF